MPKQWEATAEDCDNEYSCYDCPYKKTCKDSTFRSMIKPTKTTEINLPPDFE